MQLKISLRDFLPLIVFFTLAISCFAAMEYELRSGFGLNWYFVEEDDTQRTKEFGYFHDYNADGIQDYLFYQTNNTNKDRIFCIDTSNSATAKQYPDNRTAWKEVSW
ncbi:hypothetical protein JW926_02190, partial [Candidatus Sumerlaeota bacterium]|nr:hypothetical protein [Candidatus Sumerlaeota bacterium]